MLSPVTVTATSSLNPTATSAIHQLPTVITKPKVIMSNATQVVLNGPSAVSSLTNGSHMEIKKEINPQLQGIVEFERQRGNIPAHKNVEGTFQYKYCQILWFH